MPDLRDLAKDLKQFRRDLNAAARKANREIGRLALEEARRMSSGTVKSIVLQTPLGATHNYNPFTGKITKLSAKRHGSAFGLGAPYGHGARGWLGPRGPIPYGDPSWINRQSGAFYRSWSLRESASLGGTPELILQNGVFYAAFLQFGTSKMIRRPLDDQLNAFISEIGPPIFERHFAEAWSLRFDTK